MKMTRVFVSVFVILFIVMSIFQSSYATSTTELSNNVYIVVVNKLTLSDIENMPNLRKIINEGSLGLMNVRGTSSYTGAESFATINSSSKTYANNVSAQFHNLDWKFKEIYETRVNLLEREYAIGNIGVERLYIQNDDNKYSPKLGMLGDSLHDYGLKTAVYGNSDTDEEIMRYATLIPMDSRGLVDYGNIDSILIQNEEYPYGLKTDYDKILKEVSDVRDEASLIVIDTGDLSRLHSYSSVLSDDGFNQKRFMVLSDIDNFIADLRNVIDKDKSLLMIFSPNSGETRANGSRLSPIVLWGKNIMQGVTTSSTTNRTGIISNLDIAPAIADFLNISLYSTSGSVIEHIEKDNALNYLKTINERIDFTSSVRSKTLTTYGVISITTIAIISLVLILNIRMGSEIRKLVKTSLLIVFSLPFIFILSSLFDINSLAKFIISILAFICIYFFIILKYNSFRTLYSLTFFYFLMLIIDVIFNGFLSKYSVLSHDPIIGARYFGIGNEMVGLFLSTSMLSIGLLHSKYKNKIISTIFLLISIMILGHPELGANVGGTIAILSASLVFILEAMDKKINVKSMVCIIFIIGLAIIILGYIDVKLNPNPTHLGKTLIKIANEGFYIAENIINRKLLMNVKLVGNSFWTKVIFANIIVHGLLSYFNRKKVVNIFDGSLKIGYLSCIAGSIIGFVVNDSGLILSAIAINMITIFLLFIIVDDNAVYSRQEVK